MVELINLILSLQVEYSVIAEIEKIIISPYSTKVILIIIFFLQMRQTKKIKLIKITHAALYTATIQTLYNGGEEKKKEFKDTFNREKDQLLKEESFLSSRIKL